MIVDSADARRFGVNEDNKDIWIQHESWRTGQHWPKNRFFGKGCRKSSRQVVRLASVYARIYLSRNFQKIRNNSGTFILIYVCLRRKFLRIASDIDSVLGLVNSNPVNAQYCRKCQMCKINISKIRGHSKVNDDILRIVSASIYIVGKVTGNTSGS